MSDKTNRELIEGSEYCIEIGSETYAIPVMIIAIDRARYYFNKGEYISLEQSLENDTLPLFVGDDYEIRDWASNNMNWSDVIDHAKLISRSKVDDPQEFWCNGDWYIMSEDSDE